MASAALSGTHKSLIIVPRNYVIVARRVSEGGELMVVRNPSKESPQCEQMTRKGRVCSLGPLAELITIKGIKQKQELKDCHSAGKSDTVLIPPAMPDTLFLYQQYKLDIKALHPIAVQRKEKTKVLSKQQQTKPTEEPQPVEESKKLQHSIVLQEPILLRESVVLQEPMLLRESVVLQEPMLLRESVVLEEPKVKEEPEILEEPQKMEEPETLEKPPPLEEIKALEPLQVITEPVSKVMKVARLSVETSKEERIIEDKKQSTKVEPSTVLRQVKPKDRFDSLPSAPLTCISEYSVLVKWKQHPSIPFYSLRNVFDVLSQYGIVVAMGQLSSNSCLVLFEQFSVAINVVRAALIGPQAYPLICSWYYAYMYLDSLEILDIHPYKKYTVESEESKRMRQFRDMQEQVVSCLKNRGAGLAYDRNNFKA